MSGRPEILFPLFADLSALDGVGPKTAEQLISAGIEKPRDLLFTLPYSGIDRSRRSSVTEVDPPSYATVEVEVLEHRAPAQRGRPYRVAVRDAKTALQLVFFHARAPYLQKVLPVGARRVISGKVEVFDGIPQIVHPDYIITPEDLAEIPVFEPVYPLTGSVTQKLMAKAVAGAVSRAPELAEWIDPALRAREGWPAWHRAVTQAHTPLSLDELAPTAAARQRLAYDEFFAHQLTLSLARSRQRRGKGKRTQGDARLRDAVRNILPYTPTGAQERAFKDIEADMASERRMSRLLQGDVGAGKTLVALMALLIAVEAGGQGAMMAPTEILARQHYDSLKPMTDALGIRLDCLTGRDKGATRRAKLDDLANGDIDILVGTHAIFQESVAFADLRLAIVDEQHRFGVAQRMQLGAKGDAVDVLVMTATPIPRSLALSQYGDMDVTLLDEKPPGRTPVQTSVMSTARLPDIVAHLQSAIAEGRQAYWVCPLVEESEVSDMTAAEERFKHLRAAFGDDVVGLVHGRMDPAEKDAAMKAFSDGQTRLLVATTVIEVGVNVPNASIMVIERAERFGLAQLHQLRGRVGRGTAKSTCLLLYQAPLSDSGRRRLEILRATEDGFRIAEEDLAMRGAGDMIGTAQSGLPRFRIADLERQSALMALAQQDARKLLMDDPKLEGERGRAARILLWLTEQDRAIRLISVG